MILKNEVLVRQKELDCTAFEAYKLLLDEERNKILKEAFGVNSEGRPVFLEAISASLGSTYNGLGPTLNDNISAIVDKIDSLDNFK